MKIVVFDFEVFSKDVLLGAIVIDNNKAPFVYQTWNQEEIRKFYKDNLGAIWVGHNNQGYDNFILEAIINHRDVYLTSKEIISGNRKKYLKIKLNYFDIINSHFCSLKSIEAAVGKNISETEVDFDIDRELTQEEKLMTESYNRDDLNQTFDNLKLIKNEFQLRVDLIKEFNLPLEAFHLTETQIAERVLKPERIEGIEEMKLKPQIYPNMQVKNEKAIDYYINEKYLEIPKIKLNLCGVEHTMASGGIHAAKEKYHCNWAYYFDVSGYYNLVMMNYDLLPRGLSEEGKNLYKYMYHQQLALKKTNPNKRRVYKVILLAVFGAELNEYCKFYDPARGKLVTMVGQMFLIDLLEKLEGKVDLIQSNTDGIIAKPLEGVSDEELVGIINEWQERTGFTLKLDKIYDIHQRDVNNYMYRDDKGNIHVKGEAVKYYELWENPFTEDSYNSKEPIIVHYAIVNHYMNGISPEETIEKYKNQPRMFQYICKPLSFDYLTYETNKGEKTKLQNVNRAFALKSNEISGMIYKNKENKHDRYSNLPPNVFVYNTEINSLETINKLKTMIDYNYYVKRSYERIKEFKKDFNQLQLELWN